MLNCERCEKPSYSASMSRFNTEVICVECSQAEDKHPDIFEAKQAKHEEVMKGNYNFKGIGLPDDLKPNVDIGELADQAIENGKAFAKDLEDDRALTPSEECGSDYTLKEGQKSCWITVGNISIYIRRHADEGVDVDLYPHGDEFGDVIDSAYASFSKDMG